MCSSILLLCACEDTSQSLLQDDYNYITVMCNKLAKDNLKSPSTAKFPSTYNRIAYSSEDGKYYYSTHVDSQNSFGATTRTQMGCIWNKDNGKLQIESFIFDGKKLDINKLNFN